MEGHGVVTIGGSSGGIEALVRLAGGLPAAVLVAVHFPEGVPSALSRILSQSGPLGAIPPGDGALVEKGRIYVAPPGLHLLVEDGRVRLARGPKKNAHRPALDPLFRIAALAYGPRAVGVALTGSLDDGTAGLAAIKARGGVAVVQDPEDALFRSMPESAIRCVDADYCLPVGEVATFLAWLAREPVEERGTDPVPEDVDLEARDADLDPSVIESGRHPGELSGLTCPEYSGPLYELHDRPLDRFRCRVGATPTPPKACSKGTTTRSKRGSTPPRTPWRRPPGWPTASPTARHSGHARTSKRSATRTRRSRERAMIVRRVRTDGAAQDAV